MKNILILIVSISLITLSVLGNTDQHNSTIPGRVAPKFKMDLNQTPKERWAPIIKAYQSQLDSFVKLFNEQVKIPKIIWDIVGFYGRYFYFHKQIVHEIEAIAELSKVPFSQLFFLNFVYEFSTIDSCSGILYRNSNNTVYHGRNMDFPYADLFATLIAQIDVYRGEQYVYTGLSVVGSAFFLTAIKPGKFAINEDTRYDEPFYQVLFNILFTRATPSSWLIRYVMEQEDSYDGAVERLKNTHTDAPIYYIVSGTQPNDGCVIEKKIHGYHAFYQLNQSTWYLVQTNYDRDLEDPANDRRRWPVEQRIENLGNNLTPQQFYDNTISMWPTLNAHTIISVLMIPQNGYVNTTVWYPQ